MAQTVSNSLLECLVYGRRAATAALDEPETGRQTTVIAAPRSGDAAVSLTTREALWRDGGLSRDAAGLRQLQLSEGLLPRLLADAALLREESRGAHFRSDFPDSDPRLDGVHTVVDAEKGVRLERWS
jgi:L-aspartate oxidase